VYKGKDRIPDRPPSSSDLVVVTSGVLDGHAILSTRSILRIEPSGSELVQVICTSESEVRQILRVLDLSRSPGVNLFCSVTQRSRNLFYVWIAEATASRPLPTGRSCILTGPSNLYP
jgi:hypothetical protein